MNVPLCYFPKTTGYLVESNTGDTYIISRKNVTSNDKNNPPNPYLNEGETEYSLKVTVSRYGPALRVWIGPNEGPKRLQIPRLISPSLQNSYNL